MSAVPHGCTIATNSTAASAAVAAASFCEHHPGSTFTVLELAPTDSLIDVPAVKVVTPEEIGAPLAEIGTVAMIGGPQSLHSFFQPYLLRYLIREHRSTSVTFLDPETWVLAPFDYLLDAIARPIVLVPRSVFPLPRDGWNPTDVEVLRDGAFFAGHVTVSSLAADFLDWWADSVTSEEVDLSERCFWAHRLGACDAHWLDLVPSMFECEVLRDPSYAVAYWNLARRTVSRRTGTWTIDDVGLKSFVFSGFDARAPYLLSHKTQKLPRILLSVNAGLSELCLRYQTTLCNWRDDAGRELPSPYSTLPDRTPIDSWMRNAYRRAWVRGREGLEDLPPDPFRDNARFVEWLNTPDPAYGSVSRYLCEVWRGRDDLRKAFPDLAGADARALWNWAERSGKELNIPPILSANPSPTNSWSRDDHEPDTLPDGTPFDPWMRSAHRKASVRGRRGLENLPPSAFSDSDGFMEWLNTPHPAYGKVSRYLYEVWSSRDDLRAAFPHVAEEDAETLWNWARQFGKDELNIPRKLLAGPSPGNSPNSSARSDQSAAGGAPRCAGVTVAGFLTGELGLGVAARTLVSAIECVGIPLRTVGYADTIARTKHPFANRESSVPAAFDTNIVCMNPAETVRFAQSIGNGFFTGKYSIGLWFWEVPSVPPRLDEALKFVDEIWVTSKYVASVLRPFADVPIEIMPMAVESLVVDDFHRRELGLPDGYMFYFSFDFFSTIERKNPLGLIDAFCEAFAPGEGPILVIKGINGINELPKLELLRTRAALRPDVFIIDGFFTAERKNALMASCDCYVSLHRSEGFGLTMAEAMVLGKPIIATRFSGNLEFMNDSNSYLVDFVMGTVPPGADPPYPAGSAWSEPDLRDAARLMRFVYANREKASEKAVRGREDISSSLSIGRTGDFIARRLAEIRGPRAM